MKPRNVSQSKAPHVRTALATLVNCLSKDKWPKKKSPSGLSWLELQARDRQTLGASVAAHSTFGGTFLKNWTGQEVRNT